MLSTADARSAGTAAIRGRVVALENGRPIKGVRVQVADSRTSGASGSLTNADGVYELKALSAGRYTLHASKTGFVLVAYGQRGPRDPGRQIELTDGQTVEKADFYLPRGSVITGRVTDEQGEAMPDVTVTALEARRSNGRRSMVPAGRPAMTNDIGQFRIFGLPPGDYYVSASVRSPGVENPEASAGGVNVGYAPTYYPGTPEGNQAERLTLRIGEEASADLQLTPSRLASLAGIASDSAGQPVARGTIILRPKSDVIAANAPRRMRLAADGSFTMTGVAPGAYVLVATNTGEARNATDEGREVGSLTLAVAGEDMTGLRLVTGRGATLTGRVSFEGGAAPQDPTSIRVGCQPVTIDDIAVGATVTKVLPNRTFRLSGIMTPCIVQVQSAAGVPEGRGAWILKTARMGGSDVTDRPIPVPADGGPSSVDVVLTNQESGLSGHVEGSTAMPQDEYSVLVFPEDKTYWTGISRRIRLVRPDQTGVFKIQNLPAGDYLLVAVNSFERGAEQDPELLAQLASLARRINVVNGGMSTVTLAAPTR
jgi:hypothetical protein